MNETKEWRDKRDVTRLDYMCSPEQVRLAQNYAKYKVQEVAAKKLATKAKEDLLATLPPNCANQYQDWELLLKNGNGFPVATVKGLWFPEKEIHYTRKEYTQERILSVKRK